MAKYINAEVKNMLTTSFVAGLASLALGMGLGTLCDGLATRDVPMASYKPDAQDSGHTEIVGSKYPEYRIETYFSWDEALKHTPENLMLATKLGGYFLLIGPSSSCIRVGSYPSNHPLFGELASEWNKAREKLRV